MAICHGIRARARINLLYVCPLRFQVPPESPASRLGLYFRKTKWVARALRWARAHGVEYRNNFSKIVGTFVQCHRVNVLTNAGNLGNLDLNPITPFVDDEAQGVIPRTEPFRHTFGRLSTGLLVSARAELTIDEMGDIKKFKIGRIFLLPYNEETRKKFYPRNPFDYLGISQATCDQFNEQRVPHSVLHEHFRREVLYWHPDKDRGFNMLCALFENQRQCGKFGNVSVDRAHQVFKRYC